METHIASKAREEPVIRDWYAIDLMAYSRKSDRVICPICGGTKKVNSWVCFGCNYKWGDEARRIVQIEIGRRNLANWDWMVGENLNPTKQKAFKKANPGFHIPRDHQFTPEKSSTVKPQQASQQRRSQVVVPTDEIKKSEPPVEVPIIETVTVEASDKVDLTAEEEKNKKPLNGETNSMVKSTVTIRQPREKKIAIPETGSQAKTGKLKRKVPVERGEVVSEQALAAVLTEGDLEKISDDKIEIIPGFQVFDDIMEMMAVWNFWKRVLCPICRGYKQSAWWMCNECADKEDAQRNRWLLQWEVARREPYANFINVEENLLSPKQQEALLQQAVALLKTPLGDSFRANPGRFAKTIETLAVIPNHKRPVVFFILAKVALEAIEAVPVEDDKGDAQSVSGESGDDFADLDQIKQLVAETLPRIERNLRENEDIAKAFFTFLKMRFEIWKALREKESKNTNKATFFKEVPCSTAFFFDLKNKLQGSVKKADEISSFFGTTLEEAVVAGFQLMEAPKSAKQNNDKKKSVASADAEGNSTETQANVVNKSVLVPEENYSKKAQVLLGNIEGNLKENPLIAKAFAAFVDKRYQDWKKKGLPGGAMAFCKELGFSYQGLIALRKGGTELQGLSIQKANEVSQGINLSLEEIIALGLSNLKTVKE